MEYIANEWQYLRSLILCNVDVKYMNLKYKKEENNLPSKSGGQFIRLIEFRVELYIHLRCNWNV